MSGSSRIDTSPDGVARHYSPTSWPCGSGAETASPCVSAKVPGLRSESAPPICAITRWLGIEWQGRGGPTVTEPIRRGFGSRLIDLLLGDEECRTSRVTYDPGGVHAISAVTVDGRVGVADVHSYLVNRLTGEWTTSYGSLDPLGVLDLERFQVDAGLVDRLGLAASHFATPHPPGALMGKIRPEIAEALGLVPGLPVVAGLGDGQAAGLGVGITRPGEAYLNLGTGIVSGTFSASYRTDRAFRTMTGGIPGSYLLETFFGGGTYNINWFVEKFSDIGTRPFGLDLSPERILQAAAADLPAGADGLIALPYLSGVLTPYWDSNARGVLFGLTARHGKAHLYRAVLEGLALEQRLSTLGAEAVLGTRTGMFRLMGGGSRSPLWCQIIADVLDRPVEIAREAEATCLGAGMLAAAGAGLFDSIEEAAANMSASGDSYRPRSLETARYDRMYDVYKDLYPALRAHFARLKDVLDDFR